MTALVLWITEPNPTVAAIVAKTGVTSDESNSACLAHADETRPAEAVSCHNRKHEDAGNIHAVIPTPVERGGNPCAQREDLPKPGCRTYHHHRVAATA